jgi:hypothetical protein
VHTVGPVAAAGLAGSAAGPGSTCRCCWRLANPWRPDIWWPGSFWAAALVASHAPPELGVASLRWRSCSACAAGVPLGVVSKVPVLVLLVDLEPVSALAVHVRHHPYRRKT